MIAVTGAGVLSPLGDTTDALVHALGEGKRAFAIADFDSSRYAAVRGMRVYNRTTQLGICAGKLALDHAKLDVSAEASAARAGGETLGVVMASTFGHVDTLLEYDRSLLQNGLARTNPALMPLALPSAPGAATALAFNAKAFSITLGNGSASSLDAVGLASRLLIGGRARVCLVVSAFSPCHELTVSASKAGMLAPLVRVFDRRGEGTAFGEAAVALVLERVEDARARGVEPVGFVRGQASAFATEAASTSAAMRRACFGALRASGFAGADVGVVAAGANGGAGDRAEAQALREVLGEAMARAAVFGVKGNVGDALDASGLLQALVALAALRSGTVPPIAHADGEVFEPAVPGLRYMSAPGPVDGRCALVTATSHTGACAALVLTTELERAP